MDEAKTGRVCAQHQQWCPDGVCLYCEPALVICWQPLSTEGAERVEEFRRWLVNAILADCAHAPRPPG